MAGSTPAGTTITHDTSVAPANMDWTLFTETMFLSAGTDYLIFDTTYGANSGGVEFTDVQLTNGSFAFAPLPPTWSMLLIGLVGCGFMAHRAKSKRSPANSAA